jgi:hypothetical protein
MDIRRNMFKVANDWDHPAMGNGTSRMGEMQVSYKDLVLAFGEPMESDGYKVSGEWIFIDEDNGEVFTIYDWKSTNLYDSDAPSVETFRSLNHPVTFNIGGNHKGSVEEFKSLILTQIEYVKCGKPFEQIVLKSGADNE